MNEQYCFRGKKTTYKDGKYVASDDWVYGFMTGDGGIDNTAVAKETIGRCSGLKYVCGMTAYEGDIAVYAGKYYFIVRYGVWNQNPSNCAPAYVVGWYLEGIGIMKGGLSPVYAEDGYITRHPAHCADTPQGIERHKLEVANNIHDNPELLGGVSDE